MGPRSSPRGPYGAPMDLDTFFSRVRGFLIDLLKKRNQEEEL